MLFPSALSLSTLTLTHPLTHTYLAPSVSFKRCDLSRDLHVQIMFVLCFANQIMLNCLSPLYTYTHIHSCKCCGAWKRGARVVFKRVAGEPDRRSVLSLLVCHDVVCVAVFGVECCCVARSHRYHNHHPPPHQPPSGTDSQRCFPFRVLFNPWI